MVATLQSAPWQLLLGRVGDAVMDFILGQSVVLSPLNSAAAFAGPFAKKATAGASAAAGRAFAAKKDSHPAEKGAGFGTGGGGWAGSRRGAEAVGPLAASAAPLASSGSDCFIQVRLVSRCLCLSLFAFNSHCHA